MRDDFYHHFWVMKGGCSQVKRSALGARKTTVFTERKPAPSEIVTSLGAGAVASRTHASSVRTPKPLIQFGSSPAAEEAALRAPEAAAPAAAETASPLGAERWVLRRHIDEARETLVELRVRALANISVPRSHGSWTQGNSAAPALAGACVVLCCDDARGPAASPLATAAPL